MNKICVIFVCNKLYFDKFLKTCPELIENGKYNGDICLIIGNDLKDHDFKEELFKNKKIKIKYFPDLEFGDEWDRINNDIKFHFRRKVWQKKFQFHKFYIFHNYFKKWDYILYIDCGMNIYNDIQPILNECKTNTLFANRDGLDNETEYGGLTLRQQLINNHLNKEQKTILNNLKKNYDLNVLTFQTGLLLYDTNIITDNTFKDLIDLNLKYPISKTNEQGIMGIYFYKKWKQIKRKNNDIYFYDAVKCVKNPYIMTKKTTSRYKHIGYVNN